MEILNLQKKKNYHGPWKIRLFPSSFFRWGLVMQVRWPHICDPSASVSQVVGYRCAPRLDQALLALQSLAYNHNLNFTISFQQNAFY